MDRFLVNERLCFTCAPCRCKKPGGHTLAGNIHERIFSSIVLGEKLEVMVYLPPGFSESDPWRYPTLYLHDGQNVFDEKRAVFGVEWGVDEAAEKLILQRKIQGVIVIAVGNTSDRIALYTPFSDPKHGGGKGDLYRMFLIDELKPWIDQNYPTSLRASDTAIAGSSLGGLSSLYISWTRPDVFGKVAALSPSLWWADRSLIDYIATDETVSYPDRIWIDVGQSETLPDEIDGIPEVVADLRSLKAALLAKGFRLEESLFCREIPGAAHNESAWAARIEDVLLAMFPMSDKLSARIQAGAL